MVQTALRVDGKIMKKIKELGLDYVNDVSQGTFDIILKKKL